MKFAILLIDHLIVLYSAVAALTPFMKDKGRIISGTDANIGQFPYVVSIEVLSGDNSEFCSGSLIAPAWVLTAAHCVDRMGTVMIFLGSTLRDDAEAGYNLPPESVIRYPGYISTSILHDIALISIPETGQCSLISTIALSSSHPHGQPTYVGKHGLIIGWGSTETGAHITDHLKWGIMRVVDNTVCWIVDPTVNLAQLCAGVVMDMSPCHGDSGGPFVVESVLIGVISSFRRTGLNCEDGEPLILTRIDYYMDWIKDITGIQ